MRLDLLISQVMNGFVLVYFLELRAIPISYNNLFTLLKSSWEIMNYISKCQLDHISFHEGPAARRRILVSFI